MGRFSLQVSVDMQEGWHVGGGKGNSGNIGYVLLDHRQCPYVPGSQWKGVMRDLIRQDSDKKCLDKDDCDCTVCRLFGAPGNRRGAIRFSDLTMEQKAPIFIRAGIRIDPYCQVVADGALYLKEAVAAAQLNGLIDGFLAEPDQDLPVLLNGLRLLEAFGGGKGQGMGAIAKITVKLSGLEWRLEWGERTWQYV